MNPDFERETSDGIETHLILLGVVLAVSVLVHVFAMRSLKECAFAPLPGPAKTERKWTKDLPVMQIRKMAEDPLAQMVETRGRPAAAPDEEKQEARVERLEGRGESALAPELPAVSGDLPAAAVAAPEPARTQAAEWQPRQKVLEITETVAPDEKAALPRLVVPKVPRAAHARDVTPAFDLLPGAPVPVAAVPGAGDGAGAPSLTAGTGGGAAGAGSAGSPAPLPPPVAPAVAGVGLSAADALTRAPRLTVESEAEEARRKKGAVPPTETARTAQPPPAPPAAQRVDERVVAKEKAAVRELRDEQATAAEPFAENVRAELGAWTDPKNPKVKYFRVRLASRAERPLPVVSKDIVFLLDASGSIGNDRLKSSRAAVEEALKRLNTGDRFNVIAFRDRFTFAFPETAWKEVTKDSVETARKWMGELTAHGQTDVFRTLRNVLTMPRDPARPVVALVVTDGDPTSGMTRSSEIISKFSELNDGLVSIYMYGVKYSANAYLMDMLTRGSRGAWGCYQGHFRRWSTSEVAELSKKFDRPVLTDLSVLFSVSSNAETYPRLVSSLCEDGPVEIYGRCPAEQTELKFQVRGLNGARAHESQFRLPFAAAVVLDETVRKEWATRRVYALVAEYVKKPDDKVLKELKTFAAAHKIAVPYEKELKK